ncbi:MAG: hypothetical protein ABI743_11430, partial [bacterium]
INTVLYTSAGTRLAGYHRDDGSSQNAIEFLANGQLWGAPWTGGAFRVMRYDPMTGATISGFSPAAVSVNYGGENFGNLLYLSHSGGSGSNNGIDIVDPAGMTLVANGGTPFTNSGQETDLTVDRDGYIHQSWTRTTSLGIIRTYEYTPPSTIAFLYEWAPGTDFVTEGLGCVRSSNVIVAIHHFPSTLTFMK